MTTIRQSNLRLKRAVMGARIDRNPATVGEIRDALNQRAAMRCRRLTTTEAAAITAHYSHQLRTYGQIEVPFQLS